MRRLDIEASGSEARGITLEEVDCPSGDYVRADDALALEQRVAELERLLRGLLPAAIHGSWWDEEREAGPEDRAELDALRGLISQAEQALPYEQT